MHKEERLVITIEDLLSTGRRAEALAGKMGHLSFRRMQALVP